MNEKILVLGSNGQIGTELVTALRKAYQNDNVIACDIRRPDYETKNAGPFEFVNVLDKEILKRSFKNINRRKFTYWLRYCLPQANKTQN